MASPNSVDLDLHALGKLAHGLTERGFSDLSLVAEALRGTGLDGDVATYVAALSPLVVLELIRRAQRLRFVLHELDDAPVSSEDDEED